MTPLPFHLEFIQFLADHRTVPLTRFFLAATSLGSFSAYLLIVTLIYVAWNKQLAIRLAVLLFMSSTLNGLLKLTIRNPRPFVSEGVYLKKWAVSAHDAAVLAAEYSTPSGHAMSAAAFYSYLYRCTKSLYIRFAAVAAIVLIGASRPYLGVHYVEDVLLGWALGVACAWAAVKYAEHFGALWNKLSFRLQIAIAVTVSLAFWFLAVALNGGRFDGAPSIFVSDAGFLTGLILARPLELRFVNFDPRSSSLPAKALRLLFTFVLVQSTLFFFNLALGRPTLAWLAFVLQYLRYAAASVVTIFLAPLLFTKMGLAQTMPAQPD